MSIPVPAIPPIVSLVPLVQAALLGAPIAGLCCIGALAGLLRIWTPLDACRFNADGKLVTLGEAPSISADVADSSRQIVRA